VWEDSHVDWLYEGMRVVMAQHDLELDMLYVCNFTVRSPNVVVVMRVVLEKKIDVDVARPIAFASSLSAPKLLLPPRLPERLPAKFEEQHDGAWMPLDRREERRAPSAGSEKYLLRMLPWMTGYLDAVCARRVLLYEPGFNFILPAILEWKAKDANRRCVSCCAASDAVQLADVAARVAQSNDGRSETNGHQHQDTTECVLDSKDVLKSSEVDVAVLMSDGGVRTWKDAWYEWCVGWMRSMKRAEDKTRCLFVHLAASRKHAEELLAEMIMESDMSEVACSHTSKSYQWQQTVFTFAVVLFRAHHSLVVSECGVVWDKMVEDEIMERKNQKRRRK
jgi:hypothetical protein